MFYCRNCGGEFVTPKKSYETHCFSDTPFEVLYLCPLCKNGNFYEKSTAHCRCCGSKLPVGADEYCSDACKVKGERLWKKELKKRQNSLMSPLSLIVKECNKYNALNGTRYSYGQYVALIRPKLIKESQKCAKKRNNT